MRTSLLLLTIFLVCCEDSASVVNSPDARQIIADANVSDLYILDWTPPIPDASREELCQLVPSSDVDEYCSCFPQCCDRQRWYCPPNPRQTIDVMNVIVEVCDEAKAPCIYGSDPECPPPEILRRDECYTQWECPPGTSGEFVRWFECQLEDGTLGRQQIICDKGNLKRSIRD